MEASLACSGIVGILFIDEDLVEHYGSNSSHLASHRGRERQTWHVGIGAGRSWSGTRDGGSGRAIARLTGYVDELTHTLFTSETCKEKIKKDNLLTTAVIFGSSLLSVFKTNKI